MQLFANNTEPDVEKGGSKAETGEHAPQVRGLAPHYSPPMKFLMSANGHLG